MGEKKFPEDSVPTASTVPSPTLPLSDNFEGELDENALSGMPDAAFDVKLREFLTLNNCEQVAPLVYLYKFDHPTAGEHRSLICKYDNEIPDAHTVGLAHGSGRYLIMITTPQTRTQKQLIRGYRFRIHPHYDSLRMQMSNNATSNGTPFNNMRPVTPSPVVDTRNTISEGLQMIKEVLSIVAPLMQRPESTMPDMGAFMMKQYSAMGEVMKTNLIESGKLVAEGQRARIMALTDNSTIGDEDIENEVPEETGILAQIMPFMSQFLPVLLGSGPAATATAKAVQSLPQFSQVVNNPHEVKNLVSYLDKTKGREATDRVLKRLKIERPK